MIYKPCRFVTYQKKNSNTDKPKAIVCIVNKKGGKITCVTAFSATVTAAGSSSFSFSFSAVATAQTVAATVVTTVAAQTMVAAAADNLN